MKFCFVATLEMSVRVFLVEHIRRLQDMFELSVAVNTEEPDFLKTYDVGAKVIPVKFAREISPSADMAALVQLFLIFRREKFQIIHSIMPKTGLLSMVAGFFARAPIRVHTFTGQLWKDYTGFKRILYKLADKVIVGCATHILVDSPSQREFLISEGIVSREKSSVLGQGSICGVDTERFSLDENSRKEIRKQHSTRDDDIVFLYLGRLKRDKGILDLAKAFALLSRRYFNVHLLIVGPDEEGLKDNTLSICSQCIDRIHMVEFTDAPEKYFSAADVLCLPSYREGFGQVVAEAASVGIPSIGSNIYGITDALNDGETGYLFEAGSYHDLMQKMARFVENPSIIRTMGEKAKVNVAEKFSKERLTSAMVEYYDRFGRN